MLEKIKYSELSAKQKEIYNFQKVSALLADYGYNCIKLDDDWRGADFLAYHKDGENTLKVQLKGRLTVAKKYIGKDIWMTFPMENNWHLVPHSELLNIVEANTNWLNTPSWLEGGAYSVKSPSLKIIDLLKKYNLQ